MADYHEFDDFDSILKSIDSSNPKYYPVTDSV